VKQGLEGDPWTGEEKKESTPKHPGTGAMNSVEKLQEGPPEEIQRKVYIQLVSK
jgi:hypothetical protein